MKKIILIPALLLLFEAVPPRAGAERGAEWLHIPLTDVNSGETFTLADFAGRPVLVESFAVWCPTCTRQQKQVKALHQEVGPEIVSISLDVDPNEDAEQIREHARRNGFTWRYAVSPPELTKLLIREFGTMVVAAPAAPMILICGDQSARLLGRGVKSAERLAGEVAAACPG